MIEATTKSQAIAIITSKTGRGRRVIEKVFTMLEGQGRIKLYKDFDGRTYRISREDVEFVIKIIKREIE